MSAKVKFDGNDKYILGIMWQSEDDILKDLAFLNHFDMTENPEPHRILYSTGRGLKIKQKRQDQEKFVDPRTGDVIDISDSELNCGEVLWKGRGRGHLGSYAIKKFQLQEQLRLARPLGSGDEAIESYCRRIRTRENSTCTSNSDVDPLYTNTDYKSSRDSNEPPSRVKGYRNSALQSNALINGLLSKDKANSNLTINSSRNIKGYNSKINPNGGGYESNNDDKNITENGFIQNNRDDRLKTLYGEEHETKFESNSRAVVREIKNGENFLHKVNKLENSRMRRIYSDGSESSSSSFSLDGKDFPPLPARKP